MVFSLCKSNNTLYGPNRASGPYVGEFVLEMQNSASSNYKWSNFAVNNDSNLEEGRCCHVSMIPACVRLVTVQSTCIIQSPVSLCSIWCRLLQEVRECFHFFCIYYPHTQQRLVSVCVLLHARHLKWQLTQKWTLFCHYFLILMMFKTCILLLCFRWWKKVNDGSEWMMTEFAVFVCSAVIFFLFVCRIMCRHWLECVMMDWRAWSTWCCSRSSQLSCSPPSSAVCHTHGMAKGEIWRENKCYKYYFMVLYNNSW